jgi:hypothetical protein
VLSTCPYKQKPCIQKIEMKKIVIIAKFKFKSFLFVM